MCGRNVIEVLATLINTELSRMQLHEVDPALIRGVEGIQPQLKKLAVHFCSDPLQVS